jgi:hypothetical protein
MDFTQVPRTFDKDNSTPPEPELHDTLCTPPTFGHM